nr:Chain C, Synthetic peptide GLU-LEU-ARG-ALA-ARG-GLU-GLU-SER-TYR [synthetic construct]
ELRAREESY